MKKAIAAFALISAITATSATAGNLADPVVTPAVVMEDAAATGSTSGEVTLLIFGMLLLVAS